MNEKLNLDDVMKVATEADFDELHDWLKSKLSAFLDEELEFEKLDEIKDAINAVLEKRQELYEKALQALERRYDFEFGYNYQKSPTRTALLDVSFDMENDGARDLFHKVLVEGNLDDVLVKQVEGVTLGQGVLTHEINRQSSIQLNMPFYSTKTDSINNSLAKVRAEEDGGRILFYELEATDELTTRDRMKSQLAIASALPLKLNGAVRVHSSDSSTWSYQYRQITENLSREELERQIRPYIEEYLPEHFGGAGQSSSLSAWITDLDRRVEEAVDNGSDEFGDTLLSMEVSLPGSVLGAWFRERNEEQLLEDARAMSMRLQKGLKQLIPFYYFQDLDKLRQNSSTSALLVYAAMQLSTDFDVVDAQLTPTFKDVYWDYRDLEKLEKMVFHPLTAIRLGVLISNAHERLTKAELHGQAKFFVPSEVSDFQNASNWKKIDGGRLASLLRLESEVTHGAYGALQDIQAFRAEAATRPTKAIERLAEFGAAVTSTFNREIRSVYGGAALRPLGSLVFLEGSRALDTALRDTRANALLSVTVLEEDREFEINDFLLNKKPKMGDVAVEQRLVSLA